MKIAFGMPVYLNIYPETVISILKTVYTCANNKIGLMTLIEAGGPVHFTRSVIAHKFLASDASFLFMADSDMTWEATDFSLLLGAAQHYDLVYAEYPKRNDPERTVQKGLGFAMVNRPLLTCLAENAPKRKMCGLDGVARIFRFDDDDDKGGVSGEDCAFFEDVKKWSFSIKRLALKPGHIGHQVYQ